MAFIDVLNECVDKGLDKYLNHFEIAELWATPEKQPDIVNCYLEKISQAVCDGELDAEIFIRNPKALGGFEVIQNSPTILRQAKDDWLNGSYLQFTIHRDKFKQWLIGSSQWPLADGCLLAMWFKDEPQYKTDGDVGAGNYAVTEPKEPTLTKLEKQQAAILKAIKAKQFNPMAIPDGEKGTIKLICEADYPILFRADSSFDRAWKKGIGSQWQMEHHKSYARRGNN